jgi:hypothetical protein
VLIQDADLEYDPREYPALLEPLLDGEADVVFGSRFLGGAAPGPLLLALAGQPGCSPCCRTCFTDLNLTDMETCYKVVPRSRSSGVELRCIEDRFGIEPELTAKVASGAPPGIYEVGISYCAPGAPTPRARRSAGATASAVRRSRRGGAGAGGDVRQDVILDIVVFNRELSEAGEQP